MYGSCAARPSYPNAQITTSDAVTRIEGRHSSGTAFAFPTNVTAGGEAGTAWFGGNLIHAEPAGAW